MTLIRGRLMDGLAASLTPEQRAAVGKAESTICLVFNYQTSYDTEKCYKLRQVLVDLVKAAAERDAVTKALLAACKAALDFMVEWDVQQHVISGLSLQLHAAIALAEKETP